MQHLNAGGWGAKCVDVWALDRQAVNGKSNALRVVHARQITAALQLLDKQFSATVVGEAAAAPWQTWCVAGLGCDAVAGLPACRLAASEQLRGLDLERAAAADIDQGLMPIPGGLDSHHIRRNR